MLERVSMCDFTHESSSVAAVTDVMVGSALTELTDDMSGYPVCKFTIQLQEYTIRLHVTIFGDTRSSAHGGIIMTT